MNSNETAHYKNVVGLTALKVIAQGLETAYTPQKETLKLPNLLLLINELPATPNCKTFHNYRRLLYNI